MPPLGRVEATRRRRGRRLRRRSGMASGDEDGPGGRSQRLRPEVFHRPAAAALAGVRRGASTAAGDRVSWNGPIRAAACDTRTVAAASCCPMARSFLPSRTRTKKTSRGSVAGVICSFDGDTLAVKQVGGRTSRTRRGARLAQIAYPLPRPLLPSTIRARGQRGYVSTGARWSEMDDQAAVGLGRR